MFPRKSSGNDFWRTVSDKPFEVIQAAHETKHDLAGTYFFRPALSVRRVVTIGTPFRGSEFANATTRWGLNTTRKSAGNQSAFASAVAGGVTARSGYQNNQDNTLVRPDLSLAGFRVGAGPRRALTELVRDCRRDGTQVVLVSMPSAAEFLDRLPAAVDEGSEREVTTIVGGDGLPVAALVHEPAKGDGAAVGAVCSIAGAALEDARRQLELRTRLEEVAGSRTRILESAHELTEMDHGVRRVTLSGPGAANTLRGSSRIPSRHARRSALPSSAGFVRTACRLPSKECVT